MTRLVFQKLLQRVCGSMCTVHRAVDKIMMQSRLHATIHSRAPVSVQTVLSAMHDQPMHDCQYMTPSGRPAMLCGFQPVRQRPPSRPAADATEEGDRALRLRRRGGVEGGLRRAHQGHQAEAGHHEEVERREDHAARGPALRCGQPAQVSRVGWTGEGGGMNGTGREWEEA